MIVKFAAQAEHPTELGPAQSPKVLVIDQIPFIVPTKKLVPQDGEKSCKGYYGYDGRRLIFDLIPTTGSYRAHPCSAGFNQGSLG
jgi:hypothetical protein